MALLFDYNEVVFIKKGNIIEKEIEKFPYNNLLLFYKESLFTSTFKINISLLTSIEKLHFLKMVKNEVDYSLTLPYVEKVHDVMYLSNEIETALNSKKNIVNCKDFAITFDVKNYSDYLIFDSTNLAANPKLETIENVIINEKNYKKNQYIISVPFFRSLILLNNNSDNIELHWTHLIIDNKTALVFKVFFKNNLLQAPKFYDIHYNPNLEIGKPFSITYERRK